MNKPRPLSCGNSVPPDELSNPLLPRGAEADQTLIEHRVEGHQTPPTLANLATCPLCYLEGMNDE